MKMASEKLRQRYEEKGYVEVQCPTTAEDINSQFNVNSRVYELAYMDLDSASPEMQEAILAARQEIIYSTSWLADNDFIYLVTGNDNTHEWSTLPRFSDLFPGWDVPEEPAVVDSEDAADFFKDNYVSPRTCLFNRSVSLWKVS